MCSLLVKSSILTGNQKCHPEAYKHKEGVVPPEASRKMRGTFPPPPPSQRTEDCAGEPFQMSYTRRGDNREESDGGKPDKWCWRTSTPLISGGKKQWPGERKWRIALKQVRTSTTLPNSVTELPVKVEKGHRTPVPSYISKGEGETNQGYKGVTGNHGLSDHKGMSSETKR